MATHDETITIRPRVDLTDLDKLHRALREMEDQMNRVAAASQRIRVPGPGGSSPGGGTSPGGGGRVVPGGAPVGPVAPFPADEGPGPLPGGPVVPPGGVTTTGGGRAPALIAPQATEAARRTRRNAHGASGTGGLSSGGLLAEIQDVVAPIWPQVVQMLGGGQAGAAQHHVTQYLRQVSAMSQARATSNMGGHIAAQEALSEQFGLSGAQQTAAQAAYDAQFGAGAGPEAALGMVGSAFGPLVARQRRAQAIGRWTGAVTKGLNALGARGAARTVGQWGARLGGTAADAAAGGGAGTALDVAGGAAAGGALAGATVATAGAALLGAGLLWDGSQLKSGFTAYTQQAQPFSALQKSVGTLGESFNTLRQTINHTGLNFAESMATITQVMQTYAAAVGNTGTANLAASVKTIQGFAYGAGLSPTQVAQSMAQAAQSGLTFGKGTTLTPAQFAAQVANTTVAGGMVGRTSAVLGELLTVDQELAAQLGNPMHPGVIASVATALGKTGLPQFQGANGAQVMSQLNAGIQHPGMGAAGQMFMYQALNPNNQLGYFQEQMLQQSGLAGVNPTTGQSNLAAVLGAIRTRLLPHGIQGKQVNGQWQVSEGTAAGASLAQNVLGLSSINQTLDLLHGLQGQSLGRVSATQALAGSLTGTNGGQALATLAQHGGLTLFSELANAKGVGGPMGIAAIAKQYTTTLHGHVSAAYTHAASAYQALVRRGPQHESVHAYHVALAHDQQAMRSALGQSLLHEQGVSGTSIDKYTSAVYKSAAAWAEAGKAMTGLATAMNTLSKNVARLNQGLFGTGPSGPGRSIVGSASQPGPTGGRGGSVPSIHTQRAFQPSIPGFSGWGGTGANGTTAALAFGAGLGASSSSGSGSGMSLMSAYQPGTGSSSVGAGLAQYLGFSVAASTAAKPPSGGGGGGSAPKSAGAFLAKIGGVAQYVAQKTGLSPTLIEAQMANESGWGGSALALKYNNYAGITNGHGQYMHYSSLGAFEQGYASTYLNTPNYQHLLAAARGGASPAQQALLLGQSGWASSGYTAGSAPPGSDLVGLFNAILAALKAIHQTQKTSGKPVLA